MHVVENSPLSHYLENVNIKEVENSSATLPGIRN